VIGDPFAFPLPLGDGIVSSERVGELLRLQAEYAELDFKQALGNCSSLRRASPPLRYSKRPRFGVVDVAGDARD
jgi:hypothetical protein